MARTTGVEAKAVVQSAIVRTAELLPLDPADVCGPDAGGILMLHRHRDGLISFHRKVNGKFTNLCSIKAQDLAGMFQQVREFLLFDSYYSVNAFYRAGWGQGVAGLPAAHRKSASARYLTACYVDIDRHEQADFDFGELFGHIVTLQDQKVIPPASIISRSGRGCWLFWLLSETTDPASPTPRAWPEKVLAYRAIQRELASRLVQLGVDAGATDLARVTRVPGSINTDAQDGLVKYWVQYAASRMCYVYTLDQLGEMLEIELPQLRKKLRRNCSAEASARGRSGWQRLWYGRWSDLEALWAMRGGFQDGCRNRAAYYYAVFLRRCQLEDKAVEAAVVKLGTECRPPLSWAEIRSALRESQESSGWIRNETIGRALKLTEREAELFPHWASEHDMLLPGATYMHIPYRKRAQFRQEAILEIVTSLGGRVPPVRTMVTLLERRGIVVGHSQVANDYQRLGLSSAVEPTQRCLIASAS